MLQAFPKTDIARLVALPMPVRLLAVVGALRFVAENDAQLVGASSSDVKAIVDSGLLFASRLQRRMTDEHTIIVLTLTREGAVSVVREIGVNPASVAHTTRTTLARSPMFLDHELAVSRFALLLARSVASRLLSFERDAERLADAVHVVRRPGRLERQPLVADALAVLRDPRGVEGLLIEIDRGTERPSYLARKYQGYLAWWEDGGPARRFDVPAMRLVTVTPDDRRLQLLRETCFRATHRRASGLFWFASEKALLAHGILGPIWYTPRLEHAKLWP